MPKLRLTQKALWTPKALRYFAWADYVRECYWLALGKAQKVKPYGKDFVGRMDIAIYWSNERHGDQEGIFGSLADALFENDKELCGSFVAFHNDKKNPRVEVRISTMDKT